jgi:hypothetical protein
VVFQLPYGEWIRLFRAHGFEILDLVAPLAGGVYLAAASILSVRLMLRAVRDLMPG